jgi:hypothetical protein
MFTATEDWANNTFFETPLEETELQLMDAKC